MRQKLIAHQPRRVGGQPSGILQDAGEVAVLTSNQGAVRHQFAMVVAFDSEADLRRAIDGHRCTFRNGQAIQERIHE